jgi:hypothetical protein
MLTDELDPAVHPQHPLNRRQRARQGPQQGGLAAAVAGQQEMVAGAQLDRLGGACDGALAVADFGIFGDEDHRVAHGRRFVVLPENSKKYKLLQVFIVKVYKIYGFND